MTTVPAFLASNLFLKEQLVDPEYVPGTFQTLAANALQYRLGVSIDSSAMVAVVALAFALFAMPMPVS